MTNSYSFILRGLLSISGTISAATYPRLVSPYRTGIESA